MPQQFDESQLSDAPTAPTPFDESLLTDAPPQQYGPTAARLRQQGTMGAEQIGRTEGPPESWMMKPFGGLLGEGETAGPTEAKFQGETNLPDLGTTGQVLGGVAGGLANTAEGVAKFATSPAGAAITALSGGAGSLAPLAHAIVAGTFGVDIASKLPEQWAQTKAAAEEYGRTGNAEPLSRSLTDLAASGAFAYGMGRGALRGALEQFRGKPGAEAPPEEQPRAEAPPEEQPRAAGPPIVNFEPVMTPEERAAELLKTKDAQEAVKKAAEERRAAAVDFFKKQMPESVDDIPVPQTPEQLTRFMPTEEEVAEITRKSVYKNGAIDVDELPGTVLEKIGTEARIDGLLEDMDATRAMGGVGRYRGTTGNENFSYQKEWRGAKSPLPEELQKGFAWDEIERIISRGRQGEDLTERQQAYYDRIVSWAARNRGAPDPYRIQTWLEDHGVNVELTPIRQQIADEAVAAQERAAMQSEAAGGTHDLSAADLEFRAATGESDLMVAGKDGEPVQPLNPPELDLQEALDRLLTRAAGGDPQKIADLLGDVYGIGAPIAVKTDPSVSVPRTEEFPLPEIGKTGYAIFLPPDASPWQVAHEVGYEVRKFAGQLHEDLPHDNNLIAARVLGDLRARGFLDTHESGLPKTGFTGLGDNPLGMALGRTFDLDMPFPGAETREAQVPDLKNVFDPSGVLEPDNRTLHALIFKLMYDDVVDRVTSWRTPVENLDGALRVAFADFLREKGFDGHIWQDEMGRHLTVIDRAHPYEQGGPQADETGEARPGSPEEPRILSDHQLVKDFAEKSGATDLQMQVPLVTPFAKHTVAPFATKLYEAVKETAVGLAHALQPRLFVDDTYLDPVMKALGVKNKELSYYRVNVAVRAARQAFDKLPEAEQIEFIDKYKTGQPVRPELQPWADLIGTLEDRYYKLLEDEMQQNGKSLPYLAHHLALIYDGPPAAVQGAIRSSLAETEAKMGSHRPLEGTKDFMKKMVYQSLTEAMNNGLTPISTNPFVLMELRLADNMKFVSARRMFRNLKDVGAVRFVPFGKEREFLAKSPGWKTIDDKISRVYFPTEEGMVNAGSYFWEPNTARIINNYLSYDLVRQSKLGRGLLALKNFTTAIELGFSPFHFFFVNGDAMATGASIGVRKLARGDWKAGLKDILENVAGAPLGYFGLAGGAKRYRTEGGNLIRYIANKDEFLKTTGGQDWVAKHPNLDRTIDDLFAGGGMLHMSEAYRLRSLEAMRQSWANNDYLGVALRAFPASAQAIMEPLFDKYIPQMKLGAWMADYGQALIERQDALARGEVSRASLARTSWDRIEDRFGEMNFDNLFWNRGMKTALQLMLRSVTWKLGDARAISRAMTTGIVGQARDFDQSVLQPIVQAYRQGGARGILRADIKAPPLDADLTWIASVCMYTAVTSTIAQGIFTAHHDGKPLWPWESDTPLLDVAMPRSGGTDRNGRPSRLMVPSYMRDWVSAYKKPGAFVAHSLSAVSSRAWDVWKNKDFYGNWVFDPEAPLWRKTVDAIGHVVAVPPIGFQSLKEARKRGLTGPELVASGGGFSIASPTYFATDFEDYMTRITRREIEGRPGRSPEQAKRGEIAAKVTQAQREGKELPPEAEELGPEQLSRAARAGAREGFEGRAMRLSLSQLLDGWHYASPEEKAKLRPVLDQKLAKARLSGKSEEEQQRILAQVDEIRNEPQ